MRLLSLLFLPAIAYQTIAIFAGARHLRRRQRSRTAPASQSAFRPPISVLKPVSGLDPNTYEAFLSQARQNYSSFEILFGVRDLADPAVAVVHRLQREFPELAIRLIVGTADAPNKKAAILMGLPPGRCSMRPCESTVNTRLRQ